MSDSRVPPDFVAVARADRRMLRSHYALQLDLYFTECVELSRGRAYFAEDLADPAWNHAVLPANSDDELPRLLEEIETVCEERGRRPAVELSPAGPGRRSNDRQIRSLRARGYSRHYRYAWLVPDAGCDGTAPLPSGIEIRSVLSEEDADEFFAVFQQVYGDDLEPGYRRTLCRPGFPGVRGDVAHYLAVAQDRAVGVGTALYGRSGEAASATGLYNLAVLPAYRRCGVGSLLARHRIDEARRRGHDLIFFQTERDDVEASRCRHGFRTVFTTECFVLGEPSRDRISPRIPQ